ncbi:UNKNOWN [Stylonychia lemnae]|uniref:Uncharacterized protein n=1 Tax=Stylonychia lemnae TaxID=5949 RepID=A0A078A8G9_STYLE|nr:UNKNOWN [Stylonychia lemnae]|eukprot:CDW77862.1 UNKNOWN [Stylonychia lemnae]
MEIFLKTQHDYKKINWFSSIPEKFKHDIKEQLKKENLDFDNEHTYQVIVNMPKISGSQSRFKSSRLNSANSQKFLSEQQSVLSGGGLQMSSVANLRPQTQGIGGVNGQERHQFNRKKIMTVPTYQNLVRTREDKLHQLQQEKELNKLYENEVRQHLSEDGIPSNDIKVNTVAVKYLGITDGKIGILSRKVPIPVTVPEKEQQSRRVLSKIKSAKIINRPKQFQEIKLSTHDNIIKTDDEDDGYIPAATKPNTKEYIVQGRISEYNHLIQDKLVKKEEKSLYDVINDQRTILKTATNKKQTKDLSTGVNVPSNYHTQKSNSSKNLLNDINRPRTSVNPNYKNIQSHYKLTSLINGPDETDIMNYINQKTFHKMQQQQSQKQIVQKITQAYQEFNQAHQLVPQPEEYNQYLINKYSLPKGLRACKKQRNYSESEQQFDDRYTKENLEKINLANRRRMLGAFQQSQGLQGSKIKPVIISPKTSSYGQSGFNSKGSLLLN